MNLIIATVSLSEWAVIVGLNTAMAFGWLVTLAILERCYSGKPTQPTPTHK